MNPPAASSCGRAGRGFRDDGLLSCVTRVLTGSFPPCLKASPAASALEAMGRKEDDDLGSWKQTTNIRKTFIFMEVLGS